MAERDWKRRLGLLAHPIRSRIYTHLLGKELSASMVADLMPDVPRPSIYRHIRLLIEAGEVQVIGQRQIRGAVEKTLTVRRAPTHAVVESELPDGEAQCQVLTNTFQSLLLALRTSVEKEPSPEGFTCLFDAAYLSKEEMEELRGEVWALIKKHADQERHPGEERHLIVFSGVRDVEGS